MFGLQQSFSGCWNLRLDKTTKEDCEEQPQGTETKNLEECKHLGEVKGGGVWEADEWLLETREENPESRR